MPPAPSPEPEPDPGPELVLATVPRTSWDPKQHERNADFQRFDSGRHREAGQTVRVTRPFLLERIGFEFGRAQAALPGFRDFPDGTDFDILQQFVADLEPTDDLPITISLVLYRSPLDDGLPTVRRRTSGFGGVPLRERDAIRISDLEVVTDQPLLGRVRSGTGPSLLDLSEPVLVEPGYWLVALRADRGLDDVDLLEVSFVGIESGDEVEERIPEGGRCEYRRTADPYPDGAFHWREDATSDYFIPGFAKVNECIELGRYDVFLVMNPGDIVLDLYGTPTG